MKPLLTLVLAAALVASCKKEKETAEPVTPVPAAPSITIKVDGVEKKCSACFSSYNSNGSKGAYFNVGGISEQIYIGLSPLPALGTHALVKYGKPQLMYIKNNAYYNASAGTINITAIDTSQNGVVNKLTATFSFKTDTSSSGVSFNVTEGAINIK